MHLSHRHQLCTFDELTVHPWVFLRQLCQPRRAEPGSLLQMSEPFRYGFYGTRAEDGLEERFCSGYFETSGVRLGSPTYHCCAHGTFDLVFGSPDVSVCVGTCEGVHPESRLGMVLVKHSLGSRFPLRLRRGVGLQISLVFPKRKPGNVQPARAQRRRY